LDDANVELFMNQLPNFGSSHDFSTFGLGLRVGTIYYQNGGKMAKIDTPFMTKMDEKAYPLGQHIPI